MAPSHPKKPVASNPAASKPAAAKPVSPRPAEVVRQYGPFPDVEGVHGVTFDGARVWFATGDGLRTLDPESGETAPALAVPAHAGTAFDGRHLYQIAENRIQKLSPDTGEVVASLPAPGGGGDSGLAWAEGSLWVGHYRARKIYEIDPQSGDILRTLDSDRFVTGVTWVDGELWHGTWEGEDSSLRRVDPVSGQVLEQVDLPEGAGVSGLESDGATLFYCGGGGGKTVRAVRRPSRAAGDEPPSP